MMRITTNPNPAALRLAPDDRDGIADRAEPSQDLRQFRLIEIDLEREAVSHAWLVHRLTHLRACRCLDVRPSYSRSD